MFDPHERAGRFLSAHFHNGDESLWRAYVGTMQGANLALYYALSDLKRAVLDAVAGFLWRR